MCYWLPRRNSRREKLTRYDYVSAYAKKKKISLARWFTRNMRARGDPTAAFDCRCLHQPRLGRPRNAVNAVAVSAATVRRSRCEAAEAEGQVLLTHSFSAVAAAVDTSPVAEDDSVEPADEADDRDENFSAGDASPGEPRRYGHDADVVDCRRPPPA